VTSRYGLGVPVGNWIARAARRYLAGAGRAVARDLVLEARRRQASTPPPVPEPVRWPRRAAAVYAVWWAGIAALVLVILNVDLLLPHHGLRAGVRIALGAVLLPAGLVLAFDRDRVRPLLLSRFPDHLRVRRGVRGAAVRLLVGTGLRLLGIIWIGAGAFDLLRGIREIW
jgi:hypothetical protein